MIFTEKEPNFEIPDRRNFGRVKGRYLYSTNTNRILRMQETFTARHATRRINPEGKIRNF